MENRFRRINNKTESIMQMFFQIALLVVSMGIILLEFSNFEKDTTGITNYGFAILLGLSSVSFSWARAMKENNKNRNERVLECGRTALYGALIFILGSAFKYAGIDHGTDYLSFLHDKNNWIHYIPRALAFLCFLIALMRTNFVINELLKVIVLEQDDKWKEEINNKIPK